MMKERYRVSWFEGKKRRENSEKRRGREIRVVYADERVLPHLRSVPHLILSRKTLTLIYFQFPTFPFLSCNYRIALFFSPFFTHQSFFSLTKYKNKTKLETLIINGYHCQISQSSLFVYCSTAGAVCRCQSQVSAEKSSLSLGSSGSRRRTGICAWHLSIAAVNVILLLITDCRPGLLLWLSSQDHSGVAADGQF